MNVKKSEQADMTKRSPLYFLIGLNIVLLITFVLIEFSRKYEIPETVVVADVPILTDEEVIITERQFNEPPPPIEAPTPPEIPVEIEVVKDDVVLEDPPPVRNMNQTDIPPPSTVQGTAPSAPPAPPTLKKPPVQPTSNVDKNVNRATAKRAMIYPGCSESMSNQELYKCFNEKFQSDLRNNLDDFSMDEGDKKRRITIAFEIDKNGNLKVTGINDGGAEKEYSDNAKSAFARLSAQLERKASRGKGIVPALNSENQPATMEYSIPITFQPGN